ncbi:hypothetical protein SAMN02745150_00239 [Brevinema andersonii]|uniref:Uncharacterized protein n=1 Tax=Brevinema andersonii TaxID=34097 RepID=A0A1I1D2E1_BREAD|nr:hypothetical protein [Brevinema andersonii]SFB69081.1 hypothetical protein SAMN02745150_00239 [Brevinema andersonii]
MNFFAGASFCMSFLALVWAYKTKTEKTHQTELEEFRSQTERLIVEFNRVASRNLSMLDDRIEELERKIRLSHKVEAVLKERFEEADKYKLLQPLRLNASSDEETPPHHPKEAFGYNDFFADEAPEINNTEISEVFEGISVRSLKNYQAGRNSDTDKQKQLIGYIRQHKNKEELLELGFSINEINLALMATQNFPEAP